jgi:hypothetical protein
LCEPTLGDAQQRHQHDARPRQDHADHRYISVAAVDQRPQALDEHVGGEDEQLNGHELLRALPPNRRAVGCP